MKELSAKLTAHIEAGVRANTVSAFAYMMNYL